MKVAVDSLRRRKQVDHLPQGKFKVHLSEIKQAPEVLVAFGARCVARSVPGAGSAVAVGCSGRQHAAEGGGRAIETLLKHHIDYLQSWFMVSYNIMS